MMNKIINPIYPIYKDKNKDPKLIKRLQIFRDKNGKTFKDILLELLEEEDYDLSILRWK